MIKTVVAENGKEIKVNDTLNAKSLFIFQQYTNKDEINEEKFSLEIIKSQTDLKTDDEILELDIDTFETINNIILDSIKKYAEKKNLKLENLN